MWRWVHPIPPGFFSRRSLPEAFRTSLCWKIPMGFKVILTHLKMVGESPQNLFAWKQSLVCFVESLTRSVLHKTSTRNADFSSRETLLPDVQHKVPPLKQRKLPNTLNRPTSSTIHQRHVGVQPFRGFPPLLLQLVVPKRILDRKVAGFIVRVHLQLWCNRSRKISTTS